MKKLAVEIISGRRLNRRDDLAVFLTADLEELRAGADQIRQALCGDRADLCTIINGRSGRCSEDCKFCAQSCCYHTQAEEYPFLAEEEILAACRRDEAAGAHRFSIVTAGRSLKGEDLELALSAYRRLRRETGVKLCASHGLQTEEEFRRMKEAGILPHHVEGHRGGTWILQDYGDVVVHLFDKEARAFYDLDRLWEDAKVVDLSQVLQPGE